MTKFSGALGVLAIALSAPMMQGALQINYSVDGGPVTTCGVGPDTGPVICAATGPGISISVLSASSNSPGTAANANQEGSTLFITTTAASTVDIWFSAQDFTAPTTPPAINYTSNLSLTSTSGTGTADLTSCVDSANTLVASGTPPTLCPSSAASLTNATLAVQAANSDSASTLITSLGASPAYSLDQEIMLSLSAGAGLNVITSQVLTPVPEPATAALLGGSLLAAGLLFRKKLAAKQS